MWRATRSDKPIPKKPSGKDNSLEEELGGTSSYSELHPASLLISRSNISLTGATLHQYDLTGASQGKPSRAAARKVTLPLVQVGAFSLLPITSLLILS